MSSNYAVAGDHVVWSFFAPALDRRVTSYDLTTGETRWLSSGAGSLPAINQNRVIWREAGVSAQREMPQTLHLYDYVTNQTIPLIAKSTAIIQSHTFVNTETIAVTLNQPQSGANELYLVSVQQPGLQIDAIPASSAGVAQDGQVVVCEDRLCVGNALWSSNGVHYFAPERGINGKTFCEETYADYDSERAFWLDTAASDKLRASTLRIFAYVPGSPDCNEAISVARLLDFAQEADERGMRIGLVIHNVGMGFTFTQEQENWLRDIITTFESSSINGKPATSVIAYINVSNEINHYCGEEVDCFAMDTPGQSAINYRNEAIAWVSQTTRYIREELHSPILLTVGMATELRRGEDDHNTGAVNFFRRSSQGHTLAEYVDFLSPHNYGGGAERVMREIRGRSDMSVLLEEYGYATDPYDPSNETSVTWTEGPEDADCGINPIEKRDCERTAPWFVAQNTIAMQTRGYSSGAAFILTDMGYRECDRAPDLYTGLFPAGQSDYGCNPGGGTFTRGKGTLKTTGRVVRGFHRPYRVFLPMIMKQE